MVNTTEIQAVISPPPGPLCAPSFAADSHVGLVRDLNEDSYGYCVSSGDANAFVAVADGIGGHESGDIASNLCVRMMLTSWRAFNMGKEADTIQIRQFLEAEICRANDILFNLNKAYNIQHAMGTTIVSGVFSPASLILAHAGDSRCYMLRGSKLSQLTQDHSFVAELVRRNILSSDEAQSHPFAHIISKSIGPAQRLSPEINIHPREKGDRFLFCSDGLTNHNANEEIERVLTESKTPADAVRTLLNSSLIMGGEDNITIVCVFT